MGVIVPPHRGQCDAALRRLVFASDGIRAGMLALRDGRPFVEHCRQQTDCGKFAAIVSSLVALGQTALRELGGGGLDHVLVEGSEGKLVVTRIEGSGGLLLLAVLAERDARLGLVLGHAKTCAQAVTEAFPANAANATAAAAGA